MTQTEEWTPINGYDDLYIISNLGRVKSYQKGYWKTLKPFKNKKGYLSVQLSKNGKATNYRVHRLVALHFIPNLENKPEVNHIDENKENNAVSNLEWMTSKENNNHGTRNERMSKTLKEKYKNGEMRKTTKKVSCYEIRKTTKKVSCYEIETGDFIKGFENVIQACFYIKKPRCYSGIVDCCRGRLKTAYGYYWSYEKKDNFFDE